MLQDQVRLPHRGARGGAARAQERAAGERRCVRGARHADAAPHGRAPDPAAGARRAAEGRRRAGRAGGLDPRHPRSSSSTRSGQVVCASRPRPDGRRTSSAGLWEAYERLRGAARPARRSSRREDERVFFRDVFVMGRVERVLAAVVSRRQPTRVRRRLAAVPAAARDARTAARASDELRMRRRLRRGLLPRRPRGRRSARPGAADPAAGAGFRRRRACCASRSSSPRRCAHRPPALAGKTADKSTGDELLRALDARLSQRRIPFLSLVQRAAPRWCSPRSPTRDRPPPATCSPTCEPQRRCDRRPGARRRRLFAPLAGDRRARARCLQQAQARRAWPPGARRSRQRRGSSMS